MDGPPASRLDSIVIASKLAPPFPVCLCVEDSPADLLLVEQLIARRSDLLLLTANTGPLGLDMAQVHRPDIIFMDINLPGASGMEVLSMLRRDPSTAQIPVTALTSNAYPDQIAEGLRNGFFRYLTKPFKIAEFMVAINDMLLHASRAVALHEPPGMRRHHQDSATG